MNNVHPLLKWCEGLPQENSSIPMAGIESRLQNVKVLAGFDAWVAERLRPISAGNLWPCLSELAVASFLRDHSDNLEFIPQSGDKLGDKPPDFRIAVGSCTAFVETELLKHNSRITQELESFLEEATKKLQEKKPTCWFEYDWYRPSLTVQRQADLHLSAKESEDLQRKLNELLSQPAFAIMVGPFFEGKHLKVRIRTLHEEPEMPTCLREPVPFGFMVLKGHIQRAIHRKSGKKLTSGRRPYLLAFDFSALGIAQLPNTWSMYWKHGDLNFELPPEIDGVLILQSSDRDGQLGCRGAIRPDPGHSPYWSDAAAILDHLAPIDSHSASVAR